MPNPVGPLIAADENFTHQIPETFACVATTDPSWTEKVCAMAMANDGSLQIGFGLGKYTNRNVMDAYAAVSRGVEQRTVRASRRLAPQPDVTIVGPVHYEIVEPLHAVRFRLEANDCQPLAFDWLFESIVPPFAEERTHLQRDYRLMSELVRYHQIGTASGWIELAGERFEMTPDTWTSTRDHSWGVRYDVGLPLADVEPNDGIPAGAGFMMIWCPVLMTRRDGSQYGMHLHFTWFNMPGFEQKMVSSRIEYADGSQLMITDMQPRLRFDPNNRRLLGGELQCALADGSERTLQIEVLADTGIQLGAGLYFGFDGKHHGQWHGDLHIEGEHIADCSTPEQARRLHQIRDTVIQVTDQKEGATGVGNCQPIAYGPWPELGLADDPWM
jgi:hypothetical protein